MKFDILVQTMVNDQPPHVFVQHHGITEGKVYDLFLSVVGGQYERLEKAGNEIEFRFDHVDPAPLKGVVMSRLFRGGGICTVHVFVAHTNEARPYWEAQEARKHAAMEERERPI